MANFDLNAYEKVDQRIRRFYKTHETGRITSELVSAEGEVGNTRWVVKASVWRDRIEGPPDGTGYAFEIDGKGIANKTSALENGETSAIGRALAQIGYSGDLRATREEMAKVAAAQRDWVADAEAAPDSNAVRVLWQAASAAGADQGALDRIAEIGRQK